jgi:hypothetical protein
VRLGAKNKVGVPPRKFSKILVLKRNGADALYLCRLREQC